MAVPEDFPEILIPRPEDTAMLAGAAVVAGEILRERVADGYIQLELSDGSPNYSTEQHVIVHGRAHTVGPHMSASVVTWPWMGRGTVGATSIVYAGESQHNTRTWLDHPWEGRDRQLRRVTSEDVDGRERTIVGSEPATFGTAIDMLTEVRESSIVQRANEF